MRHLKPLPKDGEKRLLLSIYPRTLNLLGQVETRIRYGGMSRTAWINAAICEKVNRDFPHILEGGAQIDTSTEEGEKLYRAALPDIEAAKVLLSTFGELDLVSGKPIAQKPLQCRRLGPFASQAQIDEALAQDGAVELVGHDKVVTRYVTGDSPKALEPVKREKPVEAPKVDTWEPEDEETRLVMERDRAMAEEREKLKQLSEARQDADFWGDENVDFLKGNELLKKIRR